MHKRWLAGLLLGCSMAAVAASGHRSTMKDAEASMLRAGTVNVDPHGAVTFTARDPVNYQLDDAKPIAYGHWQTYVPGPRQLIPWLDASSPPDSLVAGGAYPISRGLHLLTLAGQD